MEFLLSSAFDQISSYDPASVRRGLRHIEGLLAHLCRPYTSASTSPLPSKSDRPSPGGIDTRVTDDPAYREFLRLQEGFEWNLALRLIACLERLLGQESNDLTTLLILSTLDLLQGVLLVHPASRRVFAREVNMTILLDLLEPQSSPAVIQGATVNTIVCALVEEWPTVRTFEALDGLESICTLFKRKDTDKEVKLRILEFLFFYLIPEPQGTQFSSSLTSHHHAKDKRASPSEDGWSGSSNASGYGLVVRTTQEKQRMLGKYLSNVESLMNELRQSQPFGNLMI
ncbi:cell division protein Cdc14 [Lipomyces chichibuensis]|uniref:cell division protein Cdc14 n=1 Tax=Lipomyces chichibuensis TaxID=1546026 RepID=UPI0033443746